MIPIIAGMVASIPNMLLSIFAKALTQSFMKKVLTKVIIHVGEHLVKNTKTKFDDEILEELKKALA